MNNIISKISKKTIFLYLMSAFMYGKNNKILQLKKAVFEAERSIWTHGLRKRDKLGGYNSSLSQTHQVISDTLVSGRKSIATGTQINGCDVSGSLSSLQQKYLDLRRLLQDQSAYALLTGVKLAIKTDLPSSRSRTSHAIQCSPTTDLQAHHEPPSKTILSLGPVQHIHYREAKDFQKPHQIGSVNSVIASQPYPRKSLSFSSMQDVDCHSSKKVKRLHTAKKLSLSPMDDISYHPPLDQEKPITLDLSLSDLKNKPSSSHDHNLLVGSTQQVQSLAVSDDSSNIDNGLDKEVDPVANLDQETPSNVKREDKSQKINLSFSSQECISNDSGQQKQPEDIQFVATATTPSCAVEPEKKINEKLATSSVKKTEEPLLEEVAQDRKNRLSPLVSETVTLFDSSDILIEESNNDGMAGSLTNKQEEKACKKEEGPNRLSEISFLDEVDQKSRVSDEYPESLTNLPSSIDPNLQANQLDHKIQVGTLEENKEPPSDEEKSVPIHAYVIGLIVGVVIDRSLIAVVKSSSNPTRSNKNIS